MEILNKILWAIAISFILINSVYYSIKLKIPKLELNKFNKFKNKKKDSSISQLDTLIMILSSKIGVGSLAGTALCIYYGGIGTIFWMIILAFPLGIISYIENALAIIYKDYKQNKSGPNYYIKKGLNNNKLSVIYSVLIIILYAFLFPAIQTNTISTLIKETYNVNQILISFAISITTGLIIIKGIKGISNTCNKIFPIMMILFLTLGIIVIVKNIAIIPNLFIQIIEDAFNTKSLIGGFLYKIILTFQRNVFASEAGVGTSAIIAGSTSSNDYKMQAQIGLLGTYFINLVVLLVTSIIIITAETPNLNIINGIELTQSAFFHHFSNFGEISLLIILILFSFSTIVTIYYYGESAMSSLTKKKIFIKVLKIITLISIFGGGFIKGNIIWKYTDIILALLTIINMFSIYKLKEIIVKKLK